MNKEQFTEKYIRSSHIYPMGILEDLDLLLKAERERCATDIQNINNPYPESVFPMTTKDYVKAIPNEHKRTTISGYCGRVFWNIAINEAVRIIRED